MAAFLFNSIACLSDSTLFSSTPLSQEPEAKELLRDLASFFPFPTSRIFFRVTKVWHYCVLQLLASGLGVLSYTQPEELLTICVQESYLTLPCPAITETVNQNQTTPGTGSSSRCSQEVLQGGAWGPFPLCYVIWVFPCHTALAQNGIIVGKQNSWDFPPLIFKKAKALAFLSNTCGKAQAHSSASTYQPSPSFPFDLPL